MKSWCLLALAVALFVLSSCQEPSTLYDFDEDGSLDREDCAPSDPLIHPGAYDPYGDEIDQNCDGGDGIDGDRDGYPANEELVAEAFYDCNDNDPSVHPGATEIPGNGTDEDCDGFDVLDSDGDGDPDSSDCDDNDPEINHSDDDGDGYSPCDGDCDDDDPDLSPRDEDGDGVSLCEGDCDDDDAANFPGNTEVCDGQDNDCDDEVATSEEDFDLDGYGICQGDCDDNNPQANPADADGDGYSLCGPDGVASSGDEDCDDQDPLLSAADADGDGFSTCSGDCDDSAFNTHPGADELCDGLDNDCFPATEAGTGETDGDGDGDLACADCDDTDPGITGTDIDQDGSSPCDGDCAEGNPTIHPFAVDPIDTGIDQNCDGIDGTDADGDGEASVTSGGADCDDNDPANFSGNTEICDGQDNDCNSLDDMGQAGVDGEETDDDGDGQWECQGDCDDNNPASFAGNPEVCDGQDNDCDGTTWALDEVDADSDGVLLCDSDGDGISDDCDDNDPDNFPGNPEVCDGQDNDCDPATGEDDDLDGDGLSPGCDGDCDDNDPNNFPGNSEICDGLDQNCSGAAGEVYQYDSATSQYASSDRFRGGEFSAAVNTVLKEFALDLTVSVPTNMTWLVWESSDNGSTWTELANQSTTAVGPGRAWYASPVLDLAIQPGHRYRIGAHWYQSTSYYAFVSSWTNLLPAAAGWGIHTSGLYAEGMPTGGDVFTPGNAYNMRVVTHAELDVDSDGYLPCADYVGTDPAILGGDDCDDTDAALHPTDLDGDGSIRCGPHGDCDDTDASVFPNNPDIPCDGLESDCVPDPLEVDWDGDGYLLCSPYVGTDPAILGGGDCDDSDAGLFPEDNDGDGSTCDDCDDTDASIFPGNVDTPCDGLESDCVPDPLEIDGDGDGFLPCSPYVGTDPAILGGGDCDDTDAGLTPVDDDGDGYSCNDCDDTDPSIFPSNADTPCDGIDSDCVPDLMESDADGDGYLLCSPYVGTDPAILGGDDCDDTDAGLFPGDADGDGYSQCDGDCDDGNGAAFPGNPEVCDAADNDCDGVADEGFDADGDGVGSCLDCDDGNAFNYPGNPEVCDGQDNDCDAATWASGGELDSDGSGLSDCFDCHLNPAQCGGPDAFGYCYSRAAYDPAPLGTSLNLNVDDGQTSVTLPWPFYFYGNAYFSAVVGSNGGIAFPPGTTVNYISQCLPSGGFNSPDVAPFWTDLNPSSGGQIYSLDDTSGGRFVVSWLDVPHYPNIGAMSAQLHLYPSGEIQFHWQDTDFGNALYDNGASATIGIQDTAGGTASAGNALEYSCNTPSLTGGMALRFFLCDQNDGDGDGFPAWLDCDDADANTCSTCPEVCDLEDNDCDGTADNGLTCTFPDNDGDGYTLATGDCNDNDYWVNPGVSELCNGVDTNCNNTIDEQTHCYDDDGDGYTEDGGDCDDGNAAISPTAAEVQDSVDNDCDGAVDENMLSCDVPEVEPNNDWGTANLVNVSADTDSCGAIGSNGDDDYFTLVLADPFTILTLDVDAASGGSALDSTLGLFDEDTASSGVHVQLAANDDSVAGGCSPSALTGACDSYIAKLLPDAGTYYIRLEDFAATGSSAHTYNLGFQVSNPCDTPESEPNENSSEADSFNSTGGSVCGEVSSNLDHDYFSFYALAGEVWTFNLDSWAYDSGLDAQLNLHDDTGTTLHSESVPNNGDPYFGYRIVSSGTYYIEVEADGSSASTAGPYILHGSYTTP